MQSIGHYRGFIITVIPAGGEKPQTHFFSMITMHSFGCMLCMCACTQQVVLISILLTLSLSLIVLYKQYIYTFLDRLISIASCWYTYFSREMIKQKKQSPHQKRLLFRSIVFVVVFIDTWYIHIRPFTYYVQPFSYIVLYYYNIKNYGKQFLVTQQQLWDIYLLLLPKWAQQVPKIYIYNFLF